MVFKKNEEYFDNEKVKLEEMDVDGKTVLLIDYVYKSQKALIWTDNVYMYKILFEGDYLAEMIKVAQSIE